MKKLICLILCFAMMFPASIASYAEATRSDFQDLEGIEQAELIEAYHRQGLLGGYPDGSFRPNQVLTQAELVTMINHFLGLEGNASEDLDHFSEGLWYDYELNLADDYGYRASMDFEPNALAHYDSALRLLGTVIHKDLISQSEDGPGELLTRADILSLFDQYLGYIVTSQEDLDRLPEEAERITIIGSHLLIGDRTIHGDVMISPGVAGDIIIRNSDIDGELELLGNQPDHAIQIQNSHLKTLKVFDPRHQARVLIKGDTRIDHLFIDEPASLLLEDQVIINEATFNSGGQVTGQGLIKRALIHSDAVTIDKRPLEVHIDDQVASALLGNQVMTSKDNDPDSKGSVKKPPYEDGYAPAFMQRTPFVVANSDKNNLRLTVALNETGTVYYKAFLQGQETALDVSDLMQEGDVLGVHTSYKEVDQIIESVDGLPVDPSKVYSIYLLAVDGHGNASDVFKIISDTQKDYGSGTPEDPFKIFTIEDLVSIGRPHYAIKKEWTLDQSYILMNNLDFKRASDYLDPDSSDFGDVNQDGLTQSLYSEVFEGEGWQPLEPLMGTFDGDNHEISDLMIQRKADYQGLFSQIGTRGVVKNLTINESMVAGLKHVGIITGLNEGKIIGCNVGKFNFVQGLIEGPYREDAAYQEARLKALSPLYELIAMNPDRADDYVAKAIELLGPKGDLSSPELQEARIGSLGEIYEIISRYPDSKEVVLEAIHVLTGDVGDVSSDQCQMQRAQVVGRIFSSLVRYPHMKESLLEVTDTLFGSDYYSQGRLFQMARADAMGRLIESIAHYPSLGESMIEVATRLLGTDYDASDESFQVYRAYALSSVYMGIARNPEMRPYLIETAQLMLGESYDASSDAFQAARAYSFEQLYYAIGRQPSEKDHIVAAAQELVGSDYDPSSEAFQAARASSFFEMFYTIGRSPEFADDLIDAAETLVGSQYDSSLREFQVYRAADFMRLYEAMANNPSAKDTLISTAKRLLGSDYNPSDEMFQAMRTYSISGIYQSLDVIDESTMDDVINVFYDLVGNQYDWSSESYHVNRTRSIASLLNTLAYIKDFDQTDLDKLVDLVRDLQGIPSDHVALMSMTSPLGVMATSNSAVKVASTSPALLKIDTPEVDMTSKASVQIERIRAISYLYEVLDNDDFTLIKSFVESLMGQPYGVEDSDYQIARLQSLGTALRSVAQGETLISTEAERQAYIDKINALVGERGDIKTLDYQTTRVGLMDSIFYSWGRYGENPEFMDFFNDLIGSNEEIYAIGGLAGENKGTIVSSEFEGFIQMGPGRPEK